ncbi:MAG: type II toxin-antitoxin system Phd/YefM family antitoxin [bacterium]
MTIHPQIIEKHGKKEFVILPCEEFLKILESLEDLEDLKELRKEKEKSKDLPTTPLNEVVKKLKL